MNNDQKVSKMILDFASGFIEMADSMEEKQTHLDIACAAWNMAVLPKAKKEKAFKKYFRDLKKRSADKALIKLLEEDMRELIKEKNKLFPDVLTPIVDAKIEYQNSEEYKVIAAFLR